MTSNFKSGTVWVSDNLPVLRGMNSNSVDLVYLDPPFNSNRNYEAPIGSKAAGASFKDMWTLDDIDVHEHGELADRNPGAYSVIESAKQVHGKSMMSYCIFMAVRLLELERVLRNTGSIYLHCDPTASHYLKLLMDSFFGKGNFRNELIWYYRGAGTPKLDFARRHDVILRYAYNERMFNPDPARQPYAEETKKRFNHYIGNVRGGQDFGQQSLNPKGKHPDDVITDIQPIAPSAKERLGYPTQKPLTLLERIIEVSSNEGDMILDPFCGCATSLVAADRLQRQWAGIDLSPLAVNLVNERIIKDRGPLWGKVIVPDQPPTRTDLGKMPNYRTHRHRLYGEQEGICIGCNTHFPFRVMDVDHILPRSRGGTDHMDNLQLLCSGCNRSKGNKTMAEWRAMQ